MTMKQKKAKIPDWLVGQFRIALAGEIYPQIRAIAIRYVENDDRKLLIRYYLDRNPMEFDYESIEMVSTELDSITPINYWNRIELECVFSKKLKKDLDPLDGFVYSRREYDMQDNPSP